MVTKDKKKEWYNNSKLREKSFPDVLTCSSCLEKKSSSLFYKCCVNPTGFQYSCKSCVKARDRIRYQNNRELIIKKATERNRKFKYGISPEEFNRIFYIQDGKCAICSSVLDGSKFSLKGQLDHCHKTQKVRGILCGQCNTALGNFKDDENILLSAIKYLRGE